MGNPLDIGRVAFIVLSISTASLLAGCFGSKTYPNTLDKNLHVHTATDSGSWFSHVRAAVDIHRVGEDCALDYEGTVQLTDSEIDIGIPPHRWSYLVFVFGSSSFFANRSGTITYETLLKHDQIITMRSRCVTRTTCITWGFGRLFRINPPAVKLCRWN